MTNGRAILLTGRREVRELLRSRAFRISTAVQLAIVVAVVVISGLTGGGGPRQVRRRLRRPAGAGGGRRCTLHSQSEFDAEIGSTELADEPAARAEVEDETVDAAVDVTEPDCPLGSRPRPWCRCCRAPRATVSGTAALRRAGLDQGQIEAALDPPPLSVSEVGDPVSGDGIALIGSLFLYLAILAYGIVVATAVVVEKSSRVVEVVLSAIRPVQLLTGKITGIGLLGLAQLTLVAGVGLAVALAIGAVELPESTAETAILVGVYFVLG